MSNLVQLSKDRAVVGNALALKEAASFNVRDLQLHQHTPPTQITYKMLIENNYIERFKDPDTSQLFNDENGSYVEYKQNQFSGICLKGIQRCICNNDTAIPLESITVESITENDN